MAEVTPQTLNLLREMLAAGQIDQATFNARSGQAEIAAAAPPNLGERAVAISGNNSGPIQTGVTTNVFVGTQTADSTAALRAAYLRWVVEGSNRLAIVAGGDSRQPVRLGAVYTPLMTELRDIAPRDGPRRNVPITLSDEAFADHRARPLSAVAALDREHRLVLLGGPGSGKSTFVNFLALCLAGEALQPGRDDGQPGLARLTQALPPDDEDRYERLRRRGEVGEKPAPETWQHGPLLPVVVVLRDLAAQLPPAGAAAGADSVLRYLQRQLEQASLAACRQPLEAELRDVGGLVMFDGLDEVPGAAQRREQIQQVVLSFTQSFPLVRVLVTSRTYAYQQQQWKLPGFAEAPLALFRRWQIESFVRSWYGHMVELRRVTAEDATARGDHLLRQLQAPRLAELAQRPLLLTLFARLQIESRSDLPTNRLELYHEAVRMLLTEWEKAKFSHRDGQGELQPSLSEWLKATTDDILTELQRLAFESHRDQQDLQGTADIREEAVGTALFRASGGRADAKLLLLQEYLRDRAGILVEHGVGLLQFPHRSFQEYLAACHLANDDYPAQVATLATADPTRWREVALLAAAHAARGNKALPTWALVEELCPQDLAATPDASAAWGGLLAGQVLVAAEQHKNPARRDLPKRTRVQQAQLSLLTGAALPAAERALAGQLLAALDDPRPEVMTLDAMPFCWVPPGPFLMGSDDHADDEKPQHRVDLSQGFFMARHPLSVAQWREFIDASGTAPDDSDSLQGDANQPAHDVTWFDAMRLCAFLTQRWAQVLPSGWRVRLPSEAQWEKAARGGLQLPPAAAPVGLTSLQAAVSVRASKPNPQPGREYPWGANIGTGRANVEMAVGRTSALGVYPGGRSPYGCEDMAGNVWEWTRSLWDGADGTPFGYPYDPQDHRREDEREANDRVRLVRGGAFSSTPGLARCAFRDHLQPGFRNYLLGFRVVLCSAPVL